MGRLPDFVFVGSGRCGSTTLYRQIATHPQVSCPKRKEIRFFDKHWDRGVEWYEAFFSGVSDDMVTGEASPEYLISEVAAGRMASLIPRARLLASLRNPVDRAYSHYLLNHYHRRRERLSFSEAISAEAKRPTQRRPGRFAYVGMGQYLAQLQRFMSHFPREQLLVLIFEEDIRDAPRQTFARVCRHLGIDGTFEPPNIDVRLSMTRSVHSRALRSLNGLLPPPLRPLQLAIAEANRDKAFSAPPMPRETRRRLQELFEPGYTALEEWLGRDLSVWRS